MKLTYNTSDSDCGRGAKARRSRWSSETVAAAAVTPAARNACTRCNACNKTCVNVSEKRQQTYMSICLHRERAMSAARHMSEETHVSKEETHVSTEETHVSKEETHVFQEETDVLMCINETRLFLRALLSSHDVIDVY